MGMHLMPVCILTVSQWEQPSSFIPHQETSDTKTDASDGKEKSGEEGEEADEKGQSDDDTVKKEGDGDTEKVKSSQDKGQKRKADAYGQWTTVVNDERLVNRSVSSSSRKCCPTLCGNFIVYEGVSMATVAFFLSE